MLPAPMRTTMIDDNQSRRFYDCGGYWYSNRYTFFWWIYGENCKSFVVAIPRMISRIKDYEVEIDEFHAREVELVYGTNKVKDVNKKMENEEFTFFFNFNTNLYVKY